MNVDTQNSKILIVDDTPTNLEILSNTLIDANYQVAVALNGESAIAQVKYKPPQLILLDVMMPGIDGFETCTRLKSDPETKEIPIIFMTALTDTKHKVKGLNLGAVDYITKPFQQEEVLARVQVHLQLYQLNRNLEQQVALRTTELTQALANLQQTQLQLIQSEKMSSLGQLVAGVAHEINNPINFIHGNLPHASTYVDDLIRLVNSYQNELLRLYQKYPQENNLQLDSLAEEVEWEFLETDLPKLLTSIQVGANRILNLVQSLRHFSFFEESECKVVDLHQVIDSTLTLSSHRLKAKSHRPAIEVSKQYGNISSVECYPSSLNQAFMHIFTNAIDAFDSSTTKHPQIRIHTEMRDQQWVSIRITHNGNPIPETLPKQLFTPISTLNSSCQKTDLGLSISYQIIVEQHSGDLTYNSLPQTTEFVIQLKIYLQINPKTLRLASSS